MPRDRPHAPLDETSQNREKSHTWNPHVERALQVTLSTNGGLFAGTLQLWTERARQGGRGKREAARSWISDGDENSLDWSRTTRTGIPRGVGGGWTSPLPGNGRATGTESDAVLSLRLSARVTGRGGPAGVLKPKNPRGSEGVCHRVPLNPAEHILTAKAAVVATAKRVRMRCAALLRSLAFSFDVAVPGVESSAADRRFEGGIAELEERIAGSYVSSDSGDGGPKCCPYNARRRGTALPRQRDACLKTGAVLKG
ncbi:hypothetical protein THAOC_00237 [Thalassiosira oceanica]|uniref:Uncharacterized protein n=1 Tax=Thalassiosira oceanica TaxID=159749 RepID=K0TJP7_THAOC|nr:hypothetical protein THAOC_00237 [Thalassiosira oceanica]|eukprot:EJK77900.1 hypothetical protein THAOC_00237 [Thalassiosira oceanica]